MSKSTPEFKTGISVWLRAGGPEMLVESSNAETCSCNWFSGKNLKRHNFPCEMLTTEEPLREVYYGDAETFTIAARAVITWLQERHPDLVEEGMQEMKARMFDPEFARKATTDSPGK